ncbi:hypothetical protein [Shewanella alkalitolerans]|uniref:hypothetical protein n=1 Tax=Shewanella alkalitolerans TaxID=2864209 RepID=UPI0021AD1C34|nr:hypothetical protein [Shewanella alkalitolerans]
MSKRRPHFIMGQAVVGTANDGYTLKVDFHDSTVPNTYKPDAQKMLNELEQELERLQRVIEVRTRKLSDEIAANVK